MPRARLQSRMLIPLTFGADRRTGVDQSSMGKPEGRPRRQPGPSRERLARFVHVGAGRWVLASGGAGAAFPHFRALETGSGWHPRLQRFSRPFVSIILLPSFPRACTLQHLPAILAFASWLLSKFFSSLAFPHYRGCQSLSIGFGLVQRIPLQSPLLIGPVTSYLNQRSETVPTFRLFDILSHRPFHCC